MLLTGRVPDRASWPVRPGLGAVLVTLNLMIVACTGESPRGSQPRGSNETAAGPNSSSSGSAPVAASTAGASSFAGDVSSIQNAMEAAVRAKVVPGIVVLVRRGRQVRLLARGRADVAPSVPMTPRHRFRIGSITKPMVAVVVLKLVERGVLSLEDTVEQWLPGLVRRDERSRSRSSSTTQAVSSITSTRLTSCRF